MSYKIIQARTSEDLEEAVKKYIKKGWKPLDGARCHFENSMAHDCGTIPKFMAVWSQTLVKKTKGSK